MTRSAVLIAALALAACQPRAFEPAPALPAPPPEQATDNWRDYALGDDVGRLRRLDAAWDQALRMAEAAGHAGEVRAPGALTTPHPPLRAHPHPPPGLYDCRTYKLGGQIGFVSYPTFRCRVELTPGGDLTLTKLTGSQRTAGKFYPYDDRRLVYLGGQAWGMDEAKAGDYGQIPQRDQIGLLERIGDNRWRLVLPWPRVESDLDILELSR